MWKHYIEISEIYEVFKFSHNQEFTFILKQVKSIITKSSSIALDSCLCKDVLPYPSRSNGECKSTRHKKYVTTHIFQLETTKNLLWFQPMSQMRMYGTTIYRDFRNTWHIQSLQRIYVDTITSVNGIQCLQAFHLMDMYARISFLFLVAATKNVQYHINIET
jgi:hypothetical protein